MIKAKCLKIKAEEETLKRMMKKSKQVYRLSIMISSQRFNKKMKTNKRRPKEYK